MKLINLCLPFKPCIDAPGGPFKKMFLIYNNSYFILSLDNLFTGSPRSPLSPLIPGKPGGPRGPGIIGQ